MLFQSVKGMQSKVILKMCWYQELIANTGALKEALALKVMVTKVNMIRSNCSSQSVTKQLVL